MHVRHATRFVRASIEQLVQDFLAEYGWTTAPPFGAKLVEVHLQAPKESDLKPVAGNAVFVSFGDETASRGRQLGGGLLQVEHVVFLDVLGENAGIALAIACDLKDRLEGLFGGTRFLRPTNPGTGQQLSGFVGEFREVYREQPREDLDAWQAVKATLYLDFPGSGDE